MLIGKKISKKRKLVWVSELLFSKRRYQARSLEYSFYTLVKFANIRPEKPNIISQNCPGCPFEEKIVSYDRPGDIDLSLHAIRESKLC